MPIEDLTTTRLQNLKHADGELIDTRSGLIGRADRTGTLLLIRYRHGGARRRIIVGAFPTVSLSEARKAVGAIREVDPRWGVTPKRKGVRNAPLRRNELRRIG